MARIFTDFRKMSGHLILVILLFGLAACQDETPTPMPPTAVPVGAPGEPAATTAMPVPASLPAPTNVTISTPMPTPEDSSGTVTLWHSWARADGDALVQILENFAATHPNITVQTLFVAYNDLPQAYADAVAAGGGPDLILAPAWWLRELVEADAVLPLSNDLQLDSSQWIAATVENVSIDGVLYGLPTNYELVGLYYNRSLVENVSLPTSTDELLSLATANPSLGSGLYLNFYHLYWGIPAYGSQLFNEAGQIILDKTPGTVQFLDWLLRMSNTPGTFVSLDYGMLIDRFKKGEFAFFVDGPWSSSELRQALGDNLGIVPLPSGPTDQAQPWLSGDGVFLNPIVDPSQQRLALQLARHIASGESGTILAQVAGRLPSHRDAVVNDPLLQGFTTQATSALAEPHRGQMYQVWGYAGDMLVKVIDGGMLPETAVEETTALLNDALAR